MSERTIKIIIGAVAAAVAGVATYLLGQGVLTPEIATAISALAAFIGGYLTPKTVTSVAS